MAADQPAAHRCHHHGGQEQKGQGVPHRQGIAGRGEYASVPAEDQAADGIDAQELLGQFGLLDEGDQGDECADARHLDPGQGGKGGRAAHIDGQQIDAQGKGKGPQTPEVQVEEQDRKPLGDIGDGTAHRGQPHRCGQHQGLVEQGLQGQDAALLPIPFQAVGHAGKDVDAGGAGVAVEGDARQGLEDQRGEQSKGEVQQCMEVDIQGEVSPGSAELTHQGGQRGDTSIGVDVGPGQPQPKKESGGEYPGVLLQPHPHDNQSFREAHRVPRMTKASRAKMTTPKTRSLRGSPWKRVT